MFCDREVYYGVHVNGELTQGENIADNGGVPRSYPTATRLGPQCVAAMPFRTWVRDTITQSPCCASQGSGNH